MKDWKDLLFAFVCALVFVIFCGPLAVTMWKDALSYNPSGAQAAPQGKEGGGNG